MGGGEYVAFASYLIRGPMRSWQKRNKEKRSNGSVLDIHRKTKRNGKHEVNVFKEDEATSLRM